MFLRAAMRVCDFRGWGLAAGAGGGRRRSGWVCALAASSAHKLPSSAHIAILEGKGVSPGGWGWRRKEEEWVGWG